ncbi:extracellular solute-binding protein [Brachybacterium sp. J144]|uniref:extracellular solute-binding protein n=1 Tax=Brachybacterium sp. J144 TaxID=3116487 RepID=UPI002E768F99|nr:extracellular solute-binding protein [Brachybacterium sp. J144]MEE1651418.1 extracellular solute-binding protein [Brachybacterium sp. J144]
MSSHESAARPTMPSEASPPHTTSPRGFGRRSLLLGLGALPATISLAGCSGGAGGTDSDVAMVEYEQGSSALKAELGPEIDGVPYPEGYVGPRARELEPFGDGSTTFTVLTRSENGLDLATNGHSEYLEEKTGVRIEYSTVPQGEEGSPKVNAIISSGDLPDAFMLGPEWMGGFTKAQLYAYGEQGLFQPLDQLIDEYALELQQLFEQNPDLRAAWTAPNGAMYAIPAVNQCYHCASSDTRTWVHTPSMEAAGWSEHPKTLEEFEQMLRDMKAKDPELRPFSGDSGMLPFGLIAAAFMDFGIQRIRRDGETIVYTPLDEPFRQVMEVVARLTADGLIDRNTFSQNNDQLKRLTMNEEKSLVGVVQAPHHWAIANIDFGDGNDRWKEFVPLTPFTGPGGKAPIVPWNESHGDAVGLVISSTCDDPATLVRWADAQLGLLPSLDRSMGAQGVFWDWADGTQLGIDGRTALYAKMPAEEDKPDNAAWPEFSPHNSSLDVRHGEAVDESTSIEPALFRAGQLYEAFRSPIESIYASPFFTSAQSAEIGELRTNLDTTYAQLTTQMALGDLDPTDDSHWEQYVTAFTNAGVERYLEVLTEADAARR